MFKVAIVQYKNALKSAVFGMAETLDMANDIASTLRTGIFASSHIIDNYSILENEHSQHFDLILLPPAASSQMDKSRLDRVRNQPEISQWLLQQHNQGAILAASCLGVRFLAETGLLDYRTATTHWGVAEEMQKSFPDIKMDSNLILVEQENIITAGGLMAWLDLLLCVVSRLYGMATMSLLSKQLLVGQGNRQQQYFKQFIPDRQHGDASLLKLQDYIDKNFAKTISMKQLCEHGIMTERTLQRRFQQHFSLSPTEYIQRIRIQNACQQLELTKQAAKEIAIAVGYQEIQGFRKIFRRITGLTPTEYRKQFVPM